MYIDVYIIAVGEEKSETNMICRYQTEGSMYSEFIVIGEKKERKRRKCERKDKTINMTSDYLNSPRKNE